MIALVVFGLAVAGAARHRRVPRHRCSRSSSSASPIPAPRPTSVEREVVDRIEDQHLRHQRRRQDQLDVDRRLRADHRPVRVLASDVDQATQDVRDAISAVRAQLPPEIIEPIIQRFDPNALPIVSLALTSTTLTPPQLTQLADQTIGGELRVDRRRGAGERRRRRQRAAQRRRAARATRGGGRRHRSGRERAARAEPRGAGRPGARRRSTAARRSASQGGSSGRRISRSSSSRTRNGQLDPPRPGRRRRRRARRSRRRPRCYNGAQAIGLDIVKSREYSTTAVSDAREGAPRRSCEKTLPPGTTHRDRCATPASASATRCATSRRR